MQKWCSDFGCSERHIRTPEKTHGLSQKRQAIYFKKQGTYFKISALFFRASQIPDKQQLIKSLKFGLYVWFSEVWGNRCDFGTNAHAHLPFFVSTNNRQTFPQKSRNAPPQCHKQGISAVNDRHAAFAFYCFYHALRHLFFSKHHGIALSVVNQIRSHKTRTDVGELYAEMPLPRQLLKCIDICVLKSFCC